MVTIRDAQPTDAPAIAAVHVLAWQAAYRGLLPDGYLDALSVDDRADGWERVLGEAPHPGVARLVAADDRGDVVGFIVVGPMRADGEPDGGEVHVLNVDPDAWGQGVGRGLLHEGTRRLEQAGFHTAILWVHPGNERARAFYRAAGWQLDGEERREVVWGVEVPEVRYGRRLGDVT